MQNIPLFEQVFNKGKEKNKEKQRKANKFNGTFDQYQDYFFDLKFT